MESDGRSEAAGRRARTASISFAAMSFDGVWVLRVVLLDQVAEYVEEFVGVDIANLRDRVVDSDGCDVADRPRDLIGRR